VRRRAVIQSPEYEYGVRVRERTAHSAQQPAARQSHVTRVTGCAYVALLLARLAAAGANLLAALALLKWPTCSSLQLPMPLCVVHAPPDPPGFGAVVDVQYMPPYGTCRGVITSVSGAAQLGVTFDGEETEYEEKLNWKLLSVREIISIVKPAPAPAHDGARVASTTSAAAAARVDLSKEPPRDQPAPRKKDRRTAAERRTGWGGPNRRRRHRRQRAPLPQQQQPPQPPPQQQQPQQQQGPQQEQQEQQPPHPQPQVDACQNPAGPSPTANSRRENGSPENQPREPPSGHTTSIVRTPSGRLVGGLVQDRFIATDQPEPDQQHLAAARAADDAQQPRARLQLTDHCVARGVQASQSAARHAPVDSEENELLALIHAGLAGTPPSSQNSNVLCVVDPNAGGHTDLAIEAAAAAHNEWSCALAHENNQLRTALLMRDRQLQHLMGSHTEQSAQMEQLRHTVETLQAQMYNVSQQLSNGYHAMPPSPARSSAGIWWDPPRNDSDGRNMISTDASLSGMWDEEPSLSSGAASPAIE
jgi:hypothetical protein